MVLGRYLVMVEYLDPRGSEGDSKVVHLLFCPHWGDPEVAPSTLPRPQHPPPPA